MIILHSWGGCGKRLLKASSSPAQDPGRSCPLGTPLGRRCPPGRAQSSLLVPWLRQEPLCLWGWGEKPGAAGCPGMLLVLPRTSRPGKALAWWGEGLGCSSIAPLPGWIVEPQRFAALAWLLSASQHSSQVFIFFAFSRLPAICFP